MSAMEEDYVNAESAFVTDQIQLLCLKMYEPSMFHILLSYNVICFIFLSCIRCVYDLSLLCILCR